MKMQTYRLNGQIRIKDVEGCGLWQDKARKASWCRRPGWELDGDEKRGVLYWGTKQLGQD